MSSFSIKPDVVRKESVRFEYAAADLKKYAAEIDEVKDGLDPSLAIVAPALTLVATQTRKDSKSVADIGSLIREIIRRILEAEKKILDNIKDDDGSNSNSNQNPQTDKDNDPSQGAVTPAPEDGITMEQIEQYRSLLKTLGWADEDMSDETIRELIQVMDKYGIKSKEQVCSFLAQCSHETGRGQWVTENGDDAYFATKSYSKTFRGGGYMHMTFDYAYQAYATHRLLEDHPELQEFGKYRNPANNNAASIANEYNKLIDAAKNAGIDVSDYTNIATKGADYVGANHAWDCAAYYWKTSGCNDCIAKGGTNSDVNEIVNKWDTDSFALRNQYYNTLYENYDKIFG